MAEHDQSKPPREEEIQELKEIFGMVDRDGSGSITEDELAELMQTLGIDTSQGELTAMIKELDDQANGGNGDGKIQFNEFLKVMSRKVNANFTSEQVKSAFHIFEGNDSKPGTISADSLIEALTSLGTTKLTFDNASALVQQLEPDASGNINYIDYIKMMMHD
jgi:calmodulin